MEDFEEMDEPNIKKRKEMMEFITEDNTYSM
jgi:hypothetical protein